MSRRFVIFILLSFAWAGSAYAVTVETSDSACDATNDYLQSFLTSELKNQNCESCSLADRDPSSSETQQSAAGMNQVLANPLSACVATSMRHALPPGPRTEIKYGLCRSGKNGAVITRQRNGRSLPPPCPSMELVNLVSRTFSESMKCLGLDPLEMFKLFNHESHFEPNVSSPSGVWGIGQVEQSTITLVNHKALAQESGTECGPVRRVVDNPTDFSRTSRSTCARIAIPENPERSFVYAGLYYRSNRRQIQATVDAVATRWHLAKEGADYRALILEATQYAYNGGLALVLGALDRLLEPLGNPPRNFSQVNVYFRRMLRRHASQETLGFVDAIEADARRTDCRL